MYDMTLEQETASVMAFALLHAGNPNPYYYVVPEQFKFPAMYFPRTKITTRGETFRTYASEYAMDIHILAETNEEAYERGLKVLTKIKQRRNLVPIIGEDGEETGKNLRLNDPTLQEIDSGVVQLTIEWVSRRPYDAVEPTMVQRTPHINFTNN